MNIEAPEFSQVHARESVQDSLKGESFPFALVCTFLHFKNDAGVEGREGGEGR